MKLEDLRRMYADHEEPKRTKLKAPTFADHEEPKSTELETPRHARTVTGVDLTDGSVAFKCGRCTWSVSFGIKVSSKPKHVYCPHCDGSCAMCYQLQDAEGRPLRILETGAEKRRVCAQCQLDYYDILAGAFRTSKMNDDGSWPPFDDDEWESLKSVIFSPPGTGPNAIYCSRCASVMTVKFDPISSFGTATCPVCDAVEPELEDESTSKIDR